jgi:hypothetical protein
MRTINACLVIMITILGFTNSIDFASIKEIQSLKQNSFAASLIETISLSLASSKGNGVADVKIMLIDLQTQLSNDQKTDDETFKNKNAEYDAHIEKLAKAIAVLVEEIAQLAARIEELAGLIAQAEINIESFTDRIANLNQSIIDVDQKLVDDTKYYTDKANGLAELNAKLLLVNEKLGKMIGSSSGVNKASHIATTESEKRDIAYRKAHAAAATSFIQLSKSIPMASDLVESFLQADQAALTKLMAIIAKFAGEALDQKAMAENKLAEAIETHTALRKQMVDEIALNKKSRKQQRANKVKYETEKAEKEQEKKEKEDRMAALEKEKLINEKLQKSLADTYEKERKDRAEEISVVGILIHIVDTRLE